MSNLRYRNTNLGIQWDHRIGEKEIICRNIGSSESKLALVIHDGYKLNTRHDLNTPTGYNNFICDIIFEYENDVLYSATKMHKKIIKWLNSLKLPDYDPYDKTMTVTLRDIAKKAIDQKQWFTDVTYKGFLDDFASKYARTDSRFVKRASGITPLIRNEALPRIILLGVIASMISLEE